MPFLNGTLQVFDCFLIFAGMQLAIADCALYERIIGISAFELIKNGVVAGQIFRMLFHQFAVSLQQHQRRWRDAFLAWCRIQMNQIGQRRCRLLKRNVGKRLIRARQNPVVGDAGMRNFPHVALLHVTARAIISRLPPFADLKRQCAALFVVMTCQTLFLEVCGRFFASRLHVRIMTTDATQLLAARAITLAQSH